MTKRPMTATEVFAIQREWAERNKDRWRELAVTYAAMHDAMVKRLGELLSERAAVGEQVRKQEGS